jgi:hypothetical protein
MLDTDVKSISVDKDLNYYTNPWWWLLHWKYVKIFQSTYVSFGNPDIFLLKKIIIRPFGTRLRRDWENNLWNSGNI